MTITKTLTSAADEDQAFIFHLEGNDDNTKDYAVDVMLIVAEGETVGTVTIKDVLIGEYTVSEDKNWAWRYGIDEESSETLTKILVIDVDENDFRFTNTRTETLWLSGDNWCSNWWDKKVSVSRRGA